MGKRLSDAPLRAAHRWIFASKMRLQLQRGAFLKGAKSFFTFSTPSPFGARPYIPVKEEIFGNAHQTTNWSLCVGFGKREFGGSECLRPPCLRQFTYWRTYSKLGTSHLEPLGLPFCSYYGVCEYASGDVCLTTDPRTLVVAIVNCWRLTAAVMTAWPCVSAKFLLSPRLPKTMKNKGFHPRKPGF